METENRINDLELEMARHEAQCEERWKTTFNRLDELDAGLKRIENRIMVAGGSIIVFLAGVIVTLLVG